MAGGTVGSGARIGPLERLLLASAAGDEDAFAQLYDALAPQVHGVVRSIVADLDAAAEVTGAAFLEVWRRAGQFDPDLASAHSWTLATTHLVAVRHQRAHGGPTASSEHRGDPLRLAYLGGCTEAEISTLMSTSTDTTRGLITDSLVLLSRKNG